MSMPDKSSTPNPVETVSAMSVPENGFTDSDKPNLSKLSKCKY